MRLYKSCLLIGLLCMCALHADSKPYTSKKDHFSIQPPSFIGKPKIHREADSSSFSISMTDDFGDLFLIEQTKIDDSGPNFVLVTDAVGLLTATIQSVIPKARILEQETLLLDDNTIAQFCLFDTPKGSTLAPQSTQERFDTMRGALVFIKNGYRTILHYQTDLTFINPATFPPDIANVYHCYRTALLSAANSFTPFPHKRKA